jgi:cell shape-determining protein MreC
MELNLFKSQITLDTLIKRYKEQLERVKDETQRNTLEFLIHDLTRVQATLFYYKQGVEKEFEENTNLRIKILSLENEIAELKTKQPEI